LTPAQSHEGRPVYEDGVCGASSPQTGDFHLQAADGYGTLRDYEVIVPVTHSPTVPLALAFVYHGAGATEADAKNFGLQRAPGAAEASIFVFPQGIPYERDGVGWNDSCDGYDMVFFDNMRSALEASYCIDPTSVFAAGFSWGCDQVTALACCRGNRLRAVAAASCSDDFADPANSKTYFNKQCPGSGLSAIRFTHDAAGDSGYSAQLFRTTSALYQSWNSCSPSTVPGKSVPCVAYQGCSHPLIECLYPGLGHTLPAGWAADTWDFFSSLR
jgi:poly(3-hydroxybutyrate) depolymerase